MEKRDKSEQNPTENKHSDNLSKLPKNPFRSQVSRLSHPSKTQNSTRLFDQEPNKIPSKETRQPNTLQGSSLKSKFQKLWVKILANFYGNPIRDMKLILVTGASGKSVVAHFVHEILKTSGEHVAVLASDQEIRAKTLHKFFSDAWKAGANFVVVTAPSESIDKNVFFGLPIYLTAITDTELSSAPTILSTNSETSLITSIQDLLKTKPEILVLNMDDKNNLKFSDFSGKEQTLTYGHDYKNTLRIEASKQYKMGVEATFSIGSSYLTAASFLTGEPITSYMACAAAISASINISNQTITEGLANYDPEEK